MPRYMSPHGHAHPHYICDLVLEAVRKPEPGPPRPSELPRVRVPTPQSVSSNSSVFAKVFALTHTGSLTSSSPVRTTQ